MLAQTNVLVVDNSGNVTAKSSVSAQAGVGGGTYTSGITATGSGNCIFTFTSTSGAGACAPVYPDNGQNVNTLATVTTAMLNHQYSLSGARMASILSQWNTTSIQGCSLVGGSLAP